MNDELMEFNGLWLPATEKALRPHLEQAMVAVGGPVYQWATIRAAIAHCPMGRRRRFIDIGAHVGSWSKELASEFQHVEAFEPVPILGDCFMKNVPDNNVNLYRVALGKKAGRAAMIYMPGRTGDSHILGPGEEDPNEAFNTFDVDVRTLDEFIFTEVDLVKLDCEGFERFVLAGGLDTISAWRPVVVVESKPHRNYQKLAKNAVLNYLDFIGMRLLNRVVDDFILAWPEHVDAIRHAVAARAAQPSHPPAVMEGAPVPLEEQEVIIDMDTGVAASVELDRKIAAKRTIIDDAGPVPDHAWETPPDWLPKPPAPRVTNVVPGVTTGIEDDDA